MFHHVLKYVIWGWTQGGLFVLHSNQRWQVLDLHWPPTAICQRSDVDWSRRWTWAVQSQFSHNTGCCWCRRGEVFDWTVGACLPPARHKCLQGWSNTNLEPADWMCVFKQEVRTLSWGKGWSYPETPSQHIQIQLFLLRFFFFLFKESKL